jgi:hypothetical protein
MNWYSSEGHKYAGPVNFGFLVFLFRDQIKEDVWNFFKKLKLRRKPMNIMKVPSVIADGHQLAEDILAAEAVLKPQFPGLLADAQKFKTDTEELLGINDIAAPMAPEPPKAA